MAVNPTTGKVVQMPVREDSGTKPSPSPLDTKAGLALMGGQVFLAGVLIATQVPQLEGPIPLLVLLLGLVVLANLNPVHIYGDSFISVSFVFVGAIIVMFGVPGAIIAALFDAGSSAVGRRQVDFRDFYNLAMFTTVYAAAAALYGVIAPVRPEAFAWDMIPAIGLSAVVSFGLNGLSIAAAARLYEGQPLAEFWSKHVWLAPHHVAFGLLGLALALAYVALGFAGVLVFLAPVLMLRLAMKQYVDKTAENVEKLQRQNEELRKAYVEIAVVKDELQTSYDGTLEALVNALDARDQETKGHSLRVSRYMMDIAREMGTVEGSQEWMDMQRGSLLHDVGKIGISDSILLKPGKLTDAEWELMRKHPEIGYNMLRQVKFLEGAAEIILSHHERWDGKGYPRGLRGEEIPLGARIFMVVDTFDSMTSDRPYRKALPVEKALEEILRCRGEQFDPRVVEAFLDIYPRWVDRRLGMMNEPDSLRRAA